MKIMKTKNLLIALSLVAVSASCVKENVGGNNNDSYIDTFNVAFSSDKVESKVYYDKTENVCWADGDAIGIFANNGSCPSADNLKVTGDVSEGGATATFNAELTYAGDGDYSVVAYYPYGSSVSYDKETSLLTSSIPNVQSMYKGVNNDSYDPNADFLIATPTLNVAGAEATAGALEFNRIFAPVCLTFNDSQNTMAADEMIASVVLAVPEGIAISGDFNVNVHTGELQFSKVENTVMVTLDEGYKAGSEVYMVVAPVAAETLAGQNVEITVHTTHASYKFTKSGGKFIAGKLNGATFDLKDATVIGSAESVTLYKAISNTEDWTIVDFAVETPIQTGRNYYPLAIPSSFAGWKVAINTYNVRLGGTIVPSTDGRVYMITRPSAKDNMLSEGWAPATPVTGIEGFTLNDGSKTKILVWTKIAKAGDEVNHVETSGTWNPAQVIAPAIELPAPVISEDVQEITIVDWEMTSGVDGKTTGYKVIDMPAVGAVGLVTDRVGTNNTSYSLSYIPEKYKNWKALATPIKTRYGGYIQASTSGYVYIISNYQRYKDSFLNAGWEVITNVTNGADDCMMFNGNIHAIFRKYVEKDSLTPLPDDKDGAEFYLKLENWVSFVIAPSINLAEGTTK